VKKHDDSKHIGAEIVNAPYHTAEDKPFFKKLNRVVGKLRCRMIGKKHQETGSGQKDKQHQAGTAKRPCPVKGQCFEWEFFRVDVFDKPFYGMSSASDEIFFSLLFESLGFQYHKLKFYTTGNQWHSGVSHFHTC